MTTPQYPQAPYAPPAPPQAPKKSRRGLTILIVIAALLVLGFILGKTVYPTTVAAPAPAPSATSSNDSDFLLAVDADMNTHDLLVVNSGSLDKVNAQIVSLAKAVCKAIKAGDSDRKVAKAMAASPWINPGMAADFVEQAHLYYCTTS